MDHDSNLVGMLLQERWFFALFNMEEKKRKGREKPEEKDEVEKERKTN